MAAREPLEPPPPRRADLEYRTVVEHRSNGALWGFVIVLVLLAIAVATLYATGAFGRQPLSTETGKVTAPASGGGGTGATTGGGQ
jgi:hypothetical protein